MKRKVLIISNIILAVLLAVFAVGYTYAWFANYYNVDIKLYADHDQAYFASGDGSETDPYVINNYRHLYNLAWLQNTGKIADGTYFEIAADIDMSTGGTYFVIPPIGNDKYPFNSTIDGGGCTISNLIVSTDKTKLTNFPNESATSYTFSNYVGLFGNTGEDSSISNFILDNPIVEVASSNTRYSSSGSESCVGLAVGYVNNTVYSIGVIGGILAVQQTGYTTYNSILGTINERLATSVTGGQATVGGTTSGTDLGYGTSTDIQELYTALQANDATTSNKDTPEVPSGYALPFRATSTTLYQSTYDSSTDSNTGSNNYIASQTQTLAITQEATDYNIGYYVGSGIKVYYKPNQVDYSAFYYPANSSESYLLCTATYDDETETATIDTTDKAIDKPSPSAEIVEYLMKQNTDSNGSTYRNGDYVLRVADQQNTGDYGNDNGTLVTVYGHVANYTGLIVLPHRSIWVAPVQAGTIKIVAMNVENSTMGIVVVKLTRKISGDYSTVFSSSSNLSDVTFNATLLGGKAYYFEIEVTEDDITNGYEYAISSGDNYAPYLAYVDLGQTGGNTSLSDSDGKYSTDYDVSAVDFIYSNVTIYGSNFVILGESVDATSTTLVAGTDYNYYVPTETRITLTSASTGTTAVLIIAYTRESGGSETINDTSYTIRVTYYTTGTDVPAQTKTGAYIPDSSASSDSTYFEDYYNVVSAYSGN